jgi:signal transduction histidine kinase
VFVAAVLTGPEHANAWQVTRLQLEVGSASLLLASMLAWLMAGRVLRPIRATTELARRITDTNLSDRIPVRGHDEVSAMADTFNAMLDRLQGAMAAQRQFLADAGHELRTPITIVQGNLDTMTAGDRDDAETLDLVADELSRMSRLVDELSLLAASEQPDFVRPTVADLGDLAASLATKAEALSARPWTLTSTLSGRAVLDTQRITQAVMQLAANAIAHTEPDVPLELDFRTSPGGVAFSVVDQGRGVCTTDRSRIFDRFVQLEHRHEHSTGLGLSIVAAIASAHGGSITLTDTPGGGATFTLRVPLVSSTTDPAFRSPHRIEAP